MAIMDRIFASDRNSLEITSPYEEKEDCISCRVMGMYCLLSQDFRYKGLLLMQAPRRSLL